MPETTTRGIDWNFLMDTVRDGRCILLLGPEVARTAQGQSFRQAFAESVDVPTTPWSPPTTKTTSFFSFPMPSPKAGFTTS